MFASCRVMIVLLLRNVEMSLGFGHMGGIW